MIRIRYIVNDVSEAIEFYTSNLGFTLIEQFGPAVGLLERDGVTLIVSGPMASASKPTDDGQTPVPGGWARFQIIVDDIDILVATLKENNVKFLYGIRDGGGGRKQALIQDPSGNVIELFQQD